MAVTDERAPRENHCPKAVETDAQEAFVAAFGVEPG